MPDIFVLCIFLGGIGSIILGVFESTNAIKARSDLSSLRNLLISKGLGEWSTLQNGMKTFKLK